MSQFQPETPLGLVSQIDPHQAVIIWDGRVLPGYSCTGHLPKMPSHPPAGLGFHVTGLDEAATLAEWGCVDGVPQRFRSPKKAILFWDMVGYM